MISQCLAAAISIAAQPCRESDRVLRLLESAGDQWIVRNHYVAARMVRDCLPPGCNPDAVVVQCIESSGAVPLAARGIHDGPGAQLKKLLAKVGITATPDCSCNDHAAEMDRQGVKWCEENIDTIVGWLREQAEARGLPFIDAVGRMLVRRAIENARTEAIAR